MCYLTCLSAAMGPLRVCADCFWSERKVLDGETARNVIAVAATTRAQQQAVNIRRHTAPTPAPPPTGLEESVNEGGSQRWKKGSAALIH